MVVTSDSQIDRQKIVRCASARPSVPVEDVPGRGSTTQPSVENFQTTLPILARRQERIDQHDQQAAGSPPAQHDQRRGRQKPAVPGGCRRAASSAGSSSILHPLDGTGDKGDADLLPLCQSGLAGGRALQAGDNFGPVGKAQMAMGVGAEIDQRPDAWPGSPLTRPAPRRSCSGRTPTVTGSPVRRQARHLDPVAGGKAHAARFGCAGAGSSSRR